MWIRFLPIFHMKKPLTFVQNQYDVVEGLNKSEFKELLSLATKETYFIFNAFLCKQTDFVAIGSTLGPTAANAFLCFFEKSG